MYVQVKNCLYNIKLDDIRLIMKTVGDEKLEIIYWLYDNNNYTIKFDTPSERDATFEKIANEALQIKG